jgi:hypothetical protein
MKKLKIFSVFCGVFLLCGFLAQPALSIQGDVNGDGYALTLSDLVYLTNYLFNNGPAPPNPIDADMDGTAGIDLGDQLVLTEYFYTGHIHFKPYTGIGHSFSEITFTFPVITSGGTMPFNVPLNLTDNPGPNLWGIVLAFSYQNQPGHVGVNLDSVSFTGSIVPSEWGRYSRVDNVNKKAVIWLNPTSPFYPSLSAGTTGLVATLNFTRTENPSGAVTYLSPTAYPPFNLPIVIARFSPDGSPTDRMLMPKLVFGKNGDVNCDGEINVSDVVYLTNYLYRGGPAPCVW